MSDVGPRFKGIPIRGHHLLCMLGFQGIGYTAGFIKNFQKVKRMIEQNPGLEIEVVDTCDVVCLACPNSQGEDCFKGGLKYDRTVQEMDRRVIERLGIRPGDRFRASELFEMVRQKIEPEDLKDICRGCEWIGLGFCQRGLENLKKKPVQ
jgi:hypothetical protein